MLMRDKEAANFLGLKPITLRFWRMQRKGPKFIRMGRACRYRDTDLEQFIETNSVLPEPSNGDHTHA